MFLVNLINSIRQINRHSKVTRAAVDMYTLFLYFFFVFVHCIDSLEPVILLVNFINQYIFNVCKFKTQFFYVML